MNDMTSINALFSSVDNTAQRGTNRVEELGSDAFLQLMVAQLENQDPTAPIENGAFVAQLAQFGSVSGIQDLNDSFEALRGSLMAGQSWQAASLVGRQVATEGNVGQLTPGSADGESALEATVDMRGVAGGAVIYVQDLSGRLVHSETVMPGVSGEVRFTWDGRDAAGEPMPEGLYRISGVTQIDGESKALPVYAHQRVESVAIDSSTGAVTLELSDGTSMPAARVRRYL